MWACGKRGGKDLSKDRASQTGAATGKNRGSEDVVLEILDMKQSDPAKHCDRSLKLKTKASVGKFSSGSAGKEERRGEEGQEERGENQWGSDTQL